MKHIDAHLHVRGESQYVDDVPPPAGMLHAACFGSPVAHGRVRSVDTSDAARAPGVVHVFTAGDIPGPNVIGPVVQDEVLLANDTVGFRGQPIAFVVAESHEQARAAARLVWAEIDPLPVVTCPRQAARNEDYIVPPRSGEIGHVDDAWKDCDFVVEGSCDVGGQEHVYLETNRARAIPREDQGVTIFSSTQSPNALQKTAAGILGLPMHKIEVDTKRLGGGFGGKEDQATHWGCLAAMAALRLNRPVQVVLQRDEDIAMTGKRHPYLSDFKIGLDKDGRIYAFEVTHYQNSGYFADLSGPVLERTMLHSTNSYRIPHVRVTAAACRTNLPPNTAFRGFGGPQGMFVIEAAIAKAADRIGLPRDRIQELNLLDEGDRFFYGQQVQEVRIRRCWKETVEEFDLEGVRRRVESFNREHFAEKKGFALMPVTFGISFTKTFLNQGSSLVHIYTDGTAAVSTGGIEMGQGVSSNMVAIVARKLGIRPDRVHCLSTNTTRVANMSPSAASATTDLNGNATINACDTILPGLRRTAAEMLEERDPGKVTIVDEVVHYAGSPTKITWPELVLQTWFSRRRLSAHGFYSTPDVAWDPITCSGHPFAYFSYGCCLVEVTVDCLRGRYTVDSAKVVHDLGRPIIEVVDRGQIEGGLAQGLGWMTMEELAWNDEGRVTSHALATYKVPDVYFMPDDLEVRILEQMENRYGPLGSKAVGEPPLMYGIAAFFALQQAIQAFHRDPGFAYKSPLTPERVLLELYRGQSLRYRPDAPSESTGQTASA